MKYKLYTSKSKLTAKEFIDLSKAVEWGKNRTYDLNRVAAALKKTSLIVTVRDEQNRAVACGRALSDDMFFTTVPDIFVRPEHQGRGLGRLIMQKIMDRFGHTRIFFGSQPENEGFFEKLGFRKDLQSYGMRRKG